MDWEAEAVELGGYEDYMLKEIHEQPAALGATLLGRIDADGAVDLSEMDLDLSRDRAGGDRRLWHGLPRRPARQARHREARQDTRRGRRSPASTATRTPSGTRSTLVVAISQSGETTDTLAAIEAAREFGAKVLAVTNTQRVAHHARGRRGLAHEGGAGDLRRLAPRPSSPRSPSSTCWRWSLPAFAGSCPRGDCGRSVAASGWRRRRSRRRSRCSGTGSRRPSRSSRTRGARSSWGAASRIRWRSKGL